MSKYPISTGNYREGATACGPSVGQLKEELAELKLATKDILDLLDAGYIHYEVQDTLLGNLYLRKRNLESTLNRTKKQKKETK